MFVTTRGASIAVQWVFSGLISSVQYSLFVAKRMDNERMGFGKTPAPPPPPAPEPVAKASDAENEAALMMKQKKRGRMSMDKTVQTPTLGTGLGTGLPPQGGRTTLG